MLNAANEAAVGAFLAGELHFTEIVPACRSVLESHNFESNPTLEPIDRTRSLGSRGGYALGICLIAAIDILLEMDLLVILQVALGLGAVIFVHELGHFAVAKMCGVKCEKFFIGFDIGGYKLSRKWGETEYGIGILPLGGYVKMLGQDDNPANIAEQVRESQVQEGSTDRNQGDRRPRRQEVLGR